MKNFDSDLNQKNTILADINKLLLDLWPLNRSITGMDTLRSIEILQSYCNDIKIKRVKSGTEVFDWKIPHEWNVVDAYISDLQGNKIIDWKKNNLHIYGYSKSVHRKVSREELLNHLTYLSEVPEAIPYVTSYYESTWGFCVSYNQFLEMNDSEYIVHIDSTLNPSGNMHYGEAYIPGEVDKEILLTTYICHPSMANNELSGPIMSVLLFNTLKKLKNLKYSIRLLILPETIGALYYISKNYEELRKNILFGMVVTCVGGKEPWSFLKTKFGNHSIDVIAKSVLSEHKLKFVEYSFLDRGSDERQFSGPLLNIPFISIMRSKYATYPEYHTSLDNLDFVSASAILASLELHFDILLKFFDSVFPTSNFTCEPKLSNYGLKSTLSTVNNYFVNKKFLDALTYCTGFLTIEEISLLIGSELAETVELVKRLESLKLVTMNNFPINTQPKCL